MLSEKELKKQELKIRSKISNYYDAQDVLSEALLSFYKHCKRIPKQDHLKYFKSIVKSKIIDYYRNNKNNADVSTIEMYNGYEDVNLKLIEFKSKLTDLEYNVLMLRYKYGYSKKEILKILKITSSKFNNIMEGIRCNC